MPHRRVASPATAMIMALGAGLSGCQGWFTREPSHPMPRNATAQVWTDDDVLTVHDAAVTGDSLRGRVAAAPADSFVVLPVGEIDSMRVRDLDLGATFLTASAGAIGYLLYIGLGLRGMR